MLESAGVFDLDFVELIEGELISRMGKRRPHSDTAQIVWAWLVGVFGVRYVNGEAPINVAPEDNPTNEPVPDVIVFKRSYTGFRSNIPGPQDLELVVEVADRTLDFDRTVKAALYARAAIQEYWIADIPGRRLLVHREPREGQYASITAYSENESVAPLAAPESQFRVGEAFPQ